MLDNNIDVSVLVPMFHGAGYLGNILQMTKRNIESAAHISIELVLVNDSPDDVPDFSVTADVGFPIHIAFNDKNLGIQGARLEGVKHSSGKYLFFLDQDDVIADDAIIRLYEAAGGGEMSVSDWSHEVSDGRTISPFDVAVDIGRFTLKRFCCGGNVVGPPGHCLIRRDCLPACWTKRIMKINGADDYLLWMGMLAEGREFTYCAGILYTHKWHPECFSNDGMNMALSEEEAFRIAAEEYGISPFWQWVHERHIQCRKRIVSKYRHGDSKFVRRMHLLQYPDVMFFIVLEKLGIHV